MKKLIISLLIGITINLFANNFEYKIKIIKPNLDIDKNYKIINKNIDNKFIINPNDLKNNKYNGKI